MGYASQSGRARTNATHPEAFGVCDRCGIWYNHNDLSWQFEWAGESLQNLRLLVCRECLDVPQDQLRAIIIPQDPTPIVNPRTEFFVNDETPGPTSPVGVPLGIDPRAQMPLVAGQKWAVPVKLASVISNGTATVTVNTSGAHGLATNAQVGVQGMNNKLADGEYSITVTSSTQFTYVALNAVPAGSQAGAYASIITLNVGLPYGVTTIPAVGP